MISIHAPAKGATIEMVLNGDLEANFNPRTREGCDQVCLNVISLLQDFNPRTREGCDWKFMGKRARRMFISIHAPAKGATWGKNIQGKCNEYFNPRTREGCD